MANVIYYLGAGASADAISTVEEMTNRLGLFAFMLNKYWIDLQKLGSIDEIGPIAFAEYKNDYHTEQLKKIPYRLKEFIDELKYFINKLTNRRSIDTYAKELHIRKEHEEIKKLKKVLYFYLNWEETFSDSDLNLSLSPHPSMYISELTRQNYDFNSVANIDDKNNIFYNYYKQFIVSLKKEILGDQNIDIKDILTLKKERIDQRYINFLTDILTPGDTSSNPNFPDKEIKIISWNYDNQIELACNKLNLSEFFFEKNIKPNLITLNGRCDSKDLILECDFKNFISGNAPKNVILKTAYRKSMNVLAFAIGSKDEDWSQKIKFAWEHVIAYDGSFVNSGSFYGKKHIIVIGYSFPFANRSIDADILLSIIRSAPAAIFPTDIHIQVPTKEEFENIEDRITSLISARTVPEEVKRRITFYHRFDPKNFFIPSTL